ncbi:MAG: tetratricopeptide repeat protein [Candidatus Syntrophosphaera sp.]
MKRLMIISVALLLLLAACSTTRHKLSPGANVDLKTADVYYAQQNVDEAMEFYQSVLEDNPNHAHALRRVADINLYNGELFKDRLVELNKKAYEGYDKAIRIMESYEEPKEDERSAIRDMKKRRTSAWTRIFKEGEAQYAEGNTQRAVEIFDIVAELDPTRTEPLYKLANIYQQDLKDEEKAEEILQKIYAVDSDNVDVQQQMGIFYYNKEDFASAIPYFERVYEADPTNANNLMNLSASYFEIEDYAKAKQYNDLALRIEPENTDVLTDAKFIAYRLDDVEAAIGYLKRLLSIRENDQDYLEITARLNEIKDYEEMITYAKKWHNYDETNGDAVRFVILGAQMTDNDELEAEYLEILENMQ